MATVKLNNKMRTDLRRKIISTKSNFEERREALKQEKIDIGRECYVQYLGDDLEYIEKGRSGMFNLSSTVRVKCSGEWAHLPVCGTGEDKELPFPDDKMDGAFNIPVRSPLGKRFRKYKNEIKQLSEDSSKLNSEINAVLNSCTTLNKLIETWPEIEEIAREICVVAPKKELTVNMDKLNKKLALP